MVSLVDFVNVLGYLNPEEHLNITLDNTLRKYDLAEEFIDIEPTFANLAKYAEYAVTDVVVGEKDTIELMLQIP